jgi:2,5-furandicarboxylate decarboxylase 1
MINDLRSFLKVLKENGELLEIKKEVNLKHEIGSVIATLERKGAEAAFFSNVKGHKIPVTGGLLSDHRKIALALDCKIEEVSDRMEAALSANETIKPIVVENPLFKENIITGDDIDLFSIPIPIHAPKDGGSFITAGVTISREQDLGRQNLSYQRMHIKSKNQTGVMINEWRHLKDFLDKAESEQKSLPVAVAVGVDPVVMIAAGIRTDLDEMELACTLRGKPIEVAECHTSGLLVPAHAEFIIEGEIIAGMREEEGPLAEFTGHYGLLWKSPVFKVKAICHRNNPIWQTLNGASYEHINLGNVLSREPALKKFTTYVSKSVKSVHIPPYGSGFLALISMDKKNEGEAKNVAMAAMVSHINIKTVIVLDTDVDIYNPADVLWALANRINPREDIFVVPNAQGHELDPASDRNGIQNKMGIDATLWEKKRDLKKVEYQNVDLGLYREDQ